TPSANTTATLSNLGGTNWWNGGLTVYVTDVNGLTGQAWSMVNEVVSIQLDSGLYVLCPALTTPVNANVMSGVAPYTYQWSNGATTPSIMGTVGNTYSVNVTDASGCVGHSLAQGQSSTIISASSMQVSVSTTPANCINGTATATIINPGNTVAPYTYSWSNGQTTATANNLIANQSYQVFITDAQGCIHSQFVYISSSTNLSATITTTPEYCNDLNGTASATVTGGTAPYTYSWNTGQNTSNAAGLANGYHNLWVTDANNCVAQEWAFVSETNPLAVAISSTPSDCFPANGSSTITLGGGLPPYSYYWNTSPPQMTATATNLPSGIHQITATDANGCQYNTNVTIFSNSTLSFNLLMQPEMCDQQNGSVSVNILSGVAPYTYSWSNGQTTATATNLSNGTVSVWVTDAAGCQASQTIYVTEASLISVGFTSTPPTCIYNADGSITANVLGSGTPPYSYVWWGYPNNFYNGALMLGSQASVNNLYPGNYHIAVTDANGCEANQYFGLVSANTQPCEVYLTGKAYFDQNQDCIWNNAVESTLPNAWVQVFPSGAMQMTNAVGEYNFALPTGTYSLLHYPPVWAGGGTQLCPTTAPTYNMNTAGMVQTTDYADYYSVLAQDIAITSSSWGAPPRPGFAYSRGISLSNVGTLLASGSITCVHPLGITFTGASPSPSSYDPITGTITWNYNQLQAFGGNLNFHANFTVPTTMPLGTALFFDCQANPIAGDINPSNNQHTAASIVVASYDPNYMEVSPKGSTSLGYINAIDSVLTYTTHFQNTGNFFATFVRLEIPLDVDLRTNSIEVLTASHPDYRAEITANNRLIIYFDNINLPDSLSNPIGSCGFVTFRLHLKEGLANGTQIINHSEIIFDYNAPVITNEVINTIKGTISVDDEANTTHFKLYPNPTQNEINVEFGEAQAENVLALYNVLGVKVKTLQAEKGIAKLTASIKDLTAGVYLYKAIVNGEQQQTGKIVKH
ncbi:MAG: T9SS type A sorting domain-containing protein, partial [Bacteroidia bacterium]